MKKTISIFVFVLLYGYTSAQDSLNMRLINNWDDPNMLETQMWGDIKQQYNEVWGYYDSIKKREYAIIGAAAGTYFFDVTDHDSIYMVDFELGMDTAEIHRDFKTYKNYIYGVADEGNSSLQIFDMSTLPDSVKKVYDSQEFSLRTHNGFISENGKLFLCSNTHIGGFAPMRILDIATNPEQPIFLGDLTLPPSQGNHTHDVYVKNDTAYCSNGNEGLFVYDVSDPQNIALIGSLTTYTNQGYNHESFMSQDGKTLYFVDETHGMGIKALDIRDVQNMEVISVFRSNIGAMPHNVLVKGNKLYVSYYHDGVWVFDINEPKYPEVIGYYDTYVQTETNGYDSYQGCWGVYPFLPSGTILASDMSKGLFVLKDESVVDTLPKGVEKNEAIKTAKVFPTLIIDKLFVGVPNNYGLQKIEIFDISGKRNLTETLLDSYNLYKIDFMNISNGFYTVKVIGKNRTETFKIQKM